MKQTTAETAVITTTARVTAVRLAIREASPRRLTSTLLWAAQIPLAALFVIVAVPKLTGSQQAVQEFGLIGAGQWLRYFVGTAELAGAIGLLTPWLAGLASDVMTMSLNQSETQVLGSIADALAGSDRADAAPREDPGAAWAPGDCSRQWHSGSLSRVETTLRCEAMVVGIHNCPLPR